MNITYSNEKNFIKEDAETLFLSIGWKSGEYPNRLYKALQNSSTVFTAWEGQKMVGLLRAIDDSELLAYIHYVLVMPEYQGLGIAGRLIEQAKEKYKEYLYIEIMPEKRKNAAYYKKFGFSVMEDGVPMFICNEGNKF